MNCCSSTTVPCTIPWSKTCGNMLTQLTLTTCGESSPDWYQGAEWELNTDPLGSHKLDTITLDQSGCAIHTAVSHIIFLSILIFESNSLQSGSILGHDATQERWQLLKHDNAAFVFALIWLDILAYRQISTCITFRTNSLSRTSTYVEHIFCWRRLALHVWSSSRT